MNTSSSFAGITTRRKPKKESASRKKVHRVMTEFTDGKLHSGSKTGPKVRNRKQAIAIALNEAGKGRRRKK
jgi:hypothetical protein